MFSTKLMIDAKVMTTTTTMSFRSKQRCCCLLLILYYGTVQSTAIRENIGIYQRDLWLSLSTTSSTQSRDNVDGSLINDAWSIKGRRRHHHHILGRIRSSSPWRKDLLLGLRGGGVPFDRPKIKLRSPRVRSNLDDDEVLDDYIDSLIGAGDKKGKDKKQKTLSKNFLEDEEEHDNDDNSNEESLTQESEDVDNQKPVVGTQDDEEEEEEEDNEEEDDEEEEEEEDDEEEDEEEEEEDDQTIASQGSLTAQAVEKDSDAKKDDVDPPKLKDAAVVRKARREDKKEQPQSGSVDRSSEKSLKPKISATANAETSMKDNSTSSTHTTDTEKQVASTAAGRQEEPRTMIRPVRPNFLFRFLLGQGRVGHVIILFCVMLIEFLRTYFPPIDHYLNWMEERSRRQQQIRWVRDQERRRRQQMKSSKKGGSLFRGKTQKKPKAPSRRALQKEADQRALEQLRQVGNVAMAKYRWVSTDFMKRHSLGPFATATPSVTVPSSSALEKDDSLPQQLKQQQGMVVQQAKQMRPKKNAGNAGVGSDVDWIVKALTTSTEDKPRRDRRSAPGAMSIEFQLGSDGASPPPTSPRRRRRKSASWIKAVLDSSSTVSTTLPSSPLGTTSARGKGPPNRENGVLDRLRAASGVDNMSRSLLGAYPGDAVPTSEAASSEGLLSLARKYGYGDWSDMEDDDEEEAADNYNDNDDDEWLDTASSRKTKRRRKPGSSEQKRRKRRKPEVDPLGLEDDEQQDVFDDFGDSSASHSVPKFTFPRRQSRQEGTKKKTATKRKESSTSRPRLREEEASTASSRTLPRRRRLFDDDTSNDWWQRSTSNRVEIKPPLASSTILNRSRSTTSNNNKETTDTSTRPLPQNTNKILIRPAMDRIKEKMKEMEQKK